MSGIVFCAGRSVYRVAAGSGRSRVGLIVPNATVWSSGSVRRTCSIAAKVVERPLKGAVE